MRLVGEDLGGESRHAPRHLVGEGRREVDEAVGVGLRQGEVAGLRHLFAAAVAGEELQLRSEGRRHDNSDRPFGTSPLRTI